MLAYVEKGKHARYTSRRVGLVFGIYQSSAADILSALEAAGKLTPLDGLPRAWIAANLSAEAKLPL